MSVNGKRDGFEREDLIALARYADVKRVRANQMVDRVIDAVRRWPEFAEKEGIVDAPLIQRVQSLSGPSPARPAESRCRS